MALVLKIVEFKSIYPVNFRCFDWFQIGLPQNLCRVHGAIGIKLVPNFSLLPQVSNAVCSALIRYSCESTS